jgi:hypothetical protein
MRHGEWSRLVSVAGRILLAFLFVFSQSAWAGQDPKAKDSPKPAEKTAAQQTAEKPSSAASAAKMEAEEGKAEAAGKPSKEEKSSGDGKHEGIKVHGHWTIDVRNPDGTVATHREFENALISNGALTLAALLSRSFSPGAWGILLNYAFQTPAPCADSGTGQPCIIVEPGAYPVLPGNYFPTLTVTTGTGAAASQVILTGTAIASGATSITNVVSDLYLCQSTNAPKTPCTFPNSANAPGEQGNGFTGVSLASPIAVQPGQTIAVTVTLSFS